MIELKGVSYAYDGRRALDRVSLRIDRGEHLAIIGPNASGKTTLAMVMNALLVPDEGDCIVDGVNTRDDAMHARKAVGLVFQDPERQLVSRHVRDDVSFGPRNLGLPSGDVEARVLESLVAIGLRDFVDREVRALSGGQKQLLAIAGVLAMRPSYIVMDEPTSLLDGRGVEAVDDAIAGLKKHGKGIVVITHDMSEALRADRVVVLDGGRIIADAPPRALFSDEALLSKIGVEPPYVFKLLQASGSDILPEEVCRICR
jgi:energy-coupling factor transporter ATP-binding protein EcfA2